MRFGLHYSLQSPTQEWAPLYQQCLQQITFAEKQGFDCVMFAEHHFLPDGWIPVPNLMCAAVAGMTSRIRVGTDIAILPLYHPIRIAEEAAFIDALSGGRFILGVGLGVFPKEFEAYQIPIKQRASRVEESIPLIRRLLTEQRVTHSGRYFQFENVTITPRPIQKRLPIWIGAIEEPAIMRAARLGDAWIPSQIAPFALLKKQHEVYRKTLEASGRDFSSLEHPMRKEAYVAENNDQAWEEVKDAILHEYGEVYYKESRIQAEDGHYIKPGEISFEDAVRLVRNRLIIGGPDECIAEVERYQRELGVDLMLLRIHLPGLSHWKVVKSLELIGKRIIPYFNHNTRR